MINNTWAHGLSPVAKPLTYEQAKLLAVAAMLEVQKAESVPSVEDVDLIKILDKRLEAMKLPIHFTGPAKVAVLSLCSVAGEVVVLLIDCLNAYENKTVSPTDIANIYPEGFYDRESFERYVENYIKPKKVKWAGVY